MLFSFSSLSLSSLLEKCIIGMFDYERGIFSSLWIIVIRPILN